jgi:cytochrome b subunit of formate dehydrogenase
MKRIAHGLLLAFGLMLAGGSQAAPQTQTASIPDSACLACHQAGKPEIQVPGGKDDDGNPVKRPLFSIAPDKYAGGVHAKMACVTCHTEITDTTAPHKIAEGAKAPNCAQCHLDLWKKLQDEHDADPNSRLAIVVQNIAAYKKSFHAEKSDDSPSGVKATCTDCHNTHTFNVPSRGTIARTEWHQTVPQVCGAQCHTDELDDYSKSVHGKEFKAGNKHAPVCTDCHTTHDIGNTSANPVKLVITQNCGGCHKEQYETYRNTYHGQVNRLGFTYTAKCFDCHGSHEIAKVDDPASSVSAHNRLKTCSKCHNDKKPGMHNATSGFESFAPHANSHDFKRFPVLFIVAKFMEGLLYFVFIFFWLHTILWGYREWQDRRQGKYVTRIDTHGIELDERKHFQRFPWGWRLAHLCFALITMTMILTGTTALYANSFWAPTVAKVLGGPHTMGLIHRVCASLFIGFFIVHFIYVMQKLLRDRNFRWFGPDSLIPNWKDFTDCWAMFKWFFGKGPRPLFERWSYYEKFDYWAVFWGVNIIGWSGLMMAFPYFTATYLPGWAFNITIVVHAEEAFLCAVFLFTVHFFNNHFRPGKLPPPDVVMFTGTQSLEEFRHDHPAQYQRLLDSGELQKRLVDAPSGRFHTGSVILGTILLSLGGILLVLVLMGFFRI